MSAMAQFHPKSSGFFPCVSFFKPISPSPLRHDVREQTGWKYAYLLQSRLFYICLCVTLVVL